jgi:hypothetical protein
MNVRSRNCKDVVLSYYFSYQKYQSLHTMLAYNSGSFEGRKGEHSIMV